METSVSTNDEQSIEMYYTKNENYRLIIYSYSFQGQNFSAEDFIKTYSSMRRYTLWFVRYGDSLTPIVLELNSNANEYELPYFKAIPVPMMRVLKTTLILRVVTIFMVA